MYYNALTVDKANLADLDEQTVKSLSEVPSLQTLTKSLLPENFIKYDTKEILNALPSSVFNDKLASSIEELKPAIENEVTGRFTGLKGSTLPSENSVQIDFLSLEESIEHAQNNLSASSSQQMLNIDQTNQRAEFLGAINQSYKNTINNDATLSHKQIRDLNKPELFDQKVNNTTTRALQQIKNEVQKQINSLVQDTTLRDSGQSNLQQLGNTGFSSNNREEFEVLVRLSVYWCEGTGTDKVTAAKNSATGKRLVQGISAAVDPSIIPFSSRIEIPYIGNRYAEDIGGAAKATTASTDTLPVVSIFYERKETAMIAAQSMKQTVFVKVFPPSNLSSFTKPVTLEYGTV